MAQSNNNEKKQALTYSAPKPSWLMKQFWKAAGGDAFILKQSTFSDQIKYFCLGGIVVATAVMAGMSGGYAFYTIFKPKQDNVADIWKVTEGGLNNLKGYAETTDIGTTLMAIVFGIIWGLIIYNIDRFIVTSTGKGDGTEAITWQEFKTAIPRILMGCIIAISISKPLEIRILKGELDARLQQKQLAEKDKSIKLIETKFQKNIIAPNNKIKEYQKEIDKASENYNKSVAALNAELTQVGNRGYGPEAKKIEADKERYHSELVRVQNKYEPLISEQNKQIQEYTNLKKTEMANIDMSLSGLDGLAERITLAEEHYPAVSLFLTLLFLAIELTPIFFKLMLIKSPYDYISENYKALELAENGIYVDQNYYEDKQGVQRELVRFLNAEKEIDEQREVHDSQMRLLKIALKQFEKREEEKIKENPEDFIKYS